MEQKRLVRNEKGSVVAVALIMLVLLTLLGIAVTTTSTIEIQIAGNDRIHKRTFYAAEAGIEHARELLRIRLAANILPGQLTRWDFALAGLDEIPDTSDDAKDSDGDGTGDFDGGAVWIPNGSLEGCTYTVTVWNNADGGTATTDSDGLILMRSVATGAGGAQSAIEVSLLGTGTGGVGSGYSAQEGAGSAKSYSSNDLNAIDFTQASTQL